MTVEPLSIKVYQTTAKTLSDIYGEGVFELIKYFADYADSNEVIVSYDSAEKMLDRYGKSAIKAEVLHFHTLMDKYNYDFVTISL
jgi:hypothetical protein